MEKYENKNIGGQPPFFADPDEFQNRVDKYFISGLTIKQMVVGKELIEVPTPTMAGLALFLGFESRQSLYDYEKKDGFSYIVKRARLFIERHYEELIQGSNPAGAIFALKNMGWKDQQENINHHTGGIPVNVLVNSSDTPLASHEDDADANKP